MSGWNGYALNFIGTFFKMSSNDIYNSTRYECVDNSGNPYMLYNNSNVSVHAFKVRITGITSVLLYRYIDESGIPSTFTISEDGIYELPASLSKSDMVIIGFFGRQKGLVIEQLPLYPGALVGDGIDDYGATQETISDKVGTFLVHISPVKESLYEHIQFFINIDHNYTDSLILMAYTSKNWVIGKPEIQAYTQLPIPVLTRTPAVPAEVDSEKLSLFSMYQNKPYNPGTAALYRIIMIQEQLDDAQIEFLKWKVDKEYRDWIKKNNYGINR